VEPLRGSAERNNGHGIGAWTAAGEPPAQAAPTVAQPKSLVGGWPFL